MARLREPKPYVANEWRAKVRVRVSFSFDSEIGCMMLDENEDELDAHDAAIEWAEGDAEDLKPNFFDVENFEVEVEVLEVEHLSDDESPEDPDLVALGEELDGFGIISAIAAMDEDRRFD